MTKCKHCGDAVSPFGVCAACKRPLSQLWQCPECHAEVIHGAVGHPSRQKGGHGLTDGGKPRRKILSLDRFRGDVPFRLTRPPVRGTREVTG
jgi:hypothetical protein